jgi:hypothetical protein
MSYLNLPAFTLALKRVQNPPGNHYEHHVGTVVCSLLQHYLPISENWTITPEVIQDDKKRPDFVVETFTPALSSAVNPLLEPAIFVEIKKLGGDSFVKTITQAAGAAVRASDMKDDLAVFSIVVRGVDIGFFEYYNYRTLLDENDVENFEGLIPLTQKVPAGQRESPELLQIIQGLPNDLQKPNCHTSPSFFNIWRHAQQIEELFNYIKKESPRNHC